ncbi:hypothetical protein Leryth_022466, partial [Lithospermum erythrorhizon]
ILQLTARRCPECGQNLPETYQPPSDEDWQTGIFGCTEDQESCVTGLFCPCILFGRNVENMNHDIPYSTACFFHALCVEGGITLAALTATLNGIDPDTACLITEGLCFAWWMCGIYTSMGRQVLQRKYHLKDSPCDPCLVHCCLHWCANCQEHRETKRHLEEYIHMEDTTMEPPSTQQMNPSEKHESTSDSGKENGLAIVEMRPL